MYKIDSDGCTPDNHFTNGNPQTGIPPTQIVDTWLNAVQDEITNIIITVGLLPSKNDNAQLLKAIPLIGRYGFSVLLSSSDSYGKNKSCADEVIDVTADAGARINYWINFLSSVGGGAVRLAAGTYNIQTTVSIIDGVVLFGENNKTTVLKRNADIETVVTINVSDNTKVIGAKNFRIDGNKANYNAGTKQGLNCTVTTSGQCNALLEDIIVENNLNNGFVLGGTVGGVRCVAKNNSGIGFSGGYFFEKCDSIQNAMGFSSCSYLSNCYAWRNTGSGFISCDYLINCFSNENSGAGCSTCSRLTNVIANFNLSNGFYLCKYLNGCVAKVNGNAGSGSGFNGCTYITHCNAENNIQYGLNTCKGAHYNCSTGNTTTNYYSSYTSLTANATYLIPADGSDTPNGGFNTQG